MNEGLRRIHNMPKSLLGQIIYLSGFASSDSVSMFMLDIEIAMAKPANSSAKTINPTVPAPDNTINGSIPISLGLPAIVRIPIPGTGGLCIEFTPRGWTPAGGSTSTLFFSDITGKRHLRLDYGYNIKTKTVDFHWNQKGTFAEFGMADHTTVGRTGAAFYQGAKYFRYGGRILMVVGAAIDVYSIVVASKPIRQATKVVSGWGGAWAGCQIVGRGGAVAGSFIEPGLGTAVGGIGGCVVGGAAGYWAAYSLAGRVYDWAEGTIFTRLPETSAP